jgi:hypothetical protein
LKGVIPESSRDGCGGRPEAARLSGGIVEQTRLPDKGELPGIETGVRFHLSARRRKQFSG